MNFKSNKFIENECPSSNSRFTVVNLPAKTITLTVEIFSKTTTAMKKNGCSLIQLQQAKPFKHI